MGTLHNDNLIMDEPHGKTADLSREIEASKIILEQIIKLSASTDISTAINDMLAVIGSCMKAERMYIFKDCGDFYANTYEWCAEGIRSEMAALQNLPKAEIEQWTDVFAKGGCVHISDIKEIQKTSPYIYSILESQNIKSIIEAPIIASGKLLGFLGVDNAPNEITSLITDSLTTLGAYLATAIQIRNEQENIKRQSLEIEQEQRRYREALFSNCEYCYSFDITEGIIYERFVTAHGIDIIEELGLSLPVSFDELNTRYIAEYGIIFLDQSHAAYFSTKGLIEQFESGVTNVASEYYTPKSDNYFRTAALLSKDALNNHIHAIIIAYDITDERKKEARQVQELIATREQLKLANNSMNLQLETILSGITGGFKISKDDKVFTYEYVSKGLAAIQGYTVKEFFKASGGSAVSNCYPPDLPGTMELLRKQHAKDGSYSVKYRVKHKDGSLRWVVDSGKRVVNPDGSVCYYSLIQDVTEQTNLEMTISIERGQYRDALIENADLAFSVDLTEGYLYNAVQADELYLNSNIATDESFIKYDDFLSNWIAEMQFIPLSGQTDCMMNREMLLKQFQNGLTRIDTEFYSSAYDQYYNILMLLSKIPENEHICAIFIAYNITQTKKKEEQQKKELLEARQNLIAVNKKLHASLKSEREKMSVIGAISNIYYCIHLIDLENCHISVVFSAEAPDKYFANGNNAKDVLTEWVNNELEAPFLKDADTFLDLSTLPERMKDTAIINYNCISKTSGWIRISFIAVSRDKAGILQQVLWVTQHIDEEKQKELAQQEALKTAYESANRANAAKTDFLASMSHDIRTPMNAIIGMTAIAGTHLDDRDRVSDCLGKITVASKHLLGLINEVLDMSKIESGQVDLHEEEFDFPELIDNLLTMVKPQINAKNHELSVTIRSIEHEKVIGDSQRIQQSFMNIMSNAIKYTPKGGRIALTVSEKQTNKNNVGCYEFIFEDNGIGMSEEFIGHLFEPFSRATDSRVEKIQGTGLGMAITKNMIQMMNGTIRVKSALNVGTTITVSIILRLQNVDEHISYEDFIDLPILVTDDDQLACESTCEILEELGMKGEWVLSGQEAVNLVVSRHEDKNDFFAVIIDWKMPDMDGIQTTKEIRKCIGNDVPIIIISAYDWSDIELEARAAGANAFISKPLFKSRMAHLFNELLGNKKTEDVDTSLHNIIKNDFTGKRALLVEDNDLNAEIASEILSMAGLTIDHAKDGSEALNIMTSIADNYYDIVFMDIQMPIMNGYDATVAIRALPRTYTKRVPIIAMTANAFAQDVQSAKNAGMNQHIAKPLNFRQLMDTLHKWLD